MNKHIEKAMSIRNENPMVSNCAQTILRAYAEELGITGDMAAKLSSNFGDGMIREAIELIDELVESNEG